MKISADVVGLGFAHVASRVEDIRRRVIARREAERAAREARAAMRRDVRLMTERRAQELADGKRGSP
ncbi:hypothetical protein [uncultured Hyphomicrobium sp.]|jgi:hypothetical protein|uniref:hypothetical protein n=1 Tax=uncultured Hyphomicrobium sp. TaxID=194373 RepID=UPI0025E381EB|nr:hypothetical protein [uncultured Hyphomicrobium sp.]